MVINTPTGSGARSDGYEIRTAAVRQRDPLHHDDDRRLGRRAGDRRGARAAAPSRSPCRSCTGLSRGREPRRRRGRRDRAGVLAPFGRRPLRGRRERARPAATGSSRRSTPTGPSRAAGQFYMLATRRLGRAGAAARTCRAPSRSPTAERGDGGVRLDFLLEAVGPGTERLAALEPGEALHVTGPARAARSRAPASSRPDAAGRDPGRRRDRDRAAGDPAPRARRPRRRRSACCSASATARTPAGWSSSAARRSARQRGRPRRPPGLRHRPARGAARGRRRGAAPPSTPAGRRRCSRRCAVLCAERGVAGRAGDGGADGLRLRLLLRLRGAARRRRLHAPLRRRPGRPRRRDRDGAGRRERATDDAIDSARPLRARASRTRSSTAPGPSTRSPRAAPSATRSTSASRSAPSSRRRSRPEPRAGNPPPRLYETPGGDDQLDRAAEQGPRGLPRGTTCPSSPAAGAADRLGDGDRAARGSRRWSSGSAAATRSPRSSSTSPARTSSPG